MKDNMLDKIISTVSPERGLKRALAKKKLEIFNQGYGNHGASHTRKSLIGWEYQGGSVDEDITRNLSTLRQRCRDLDSGGGMARSAHRTMRTNIIGSGLTVKPKIDGDFLKMTPEQVNKWQKQIQREFGLWAESKLCDADKRCNFYELQQLAQLSWLMSGDVFVLLPYKNEKKMPYELRIKLIEADRCCTPNHIYDDAIPVLLENGNRIIAGVEENKDGCVVAYHIADKHPLNYTDYQRVIKWHRIEPYGKNTGRRNVLHLMEQERPGQSRGVPLLAPVIESLKQLERYTNAELMAAVVSGMLTVFIETSSTSPDTPTGSGIDEEQRISDSDSDYELGNGSIIALAENEKATAVNPGRPNTSFEGFVVAICKQVGAALEIPYEVLLKSFNSNYSASRGALLEAWKAFRMHRDWMIDDFCQPIYEEFLIEAVAKGRIYAPGFFDDPIIQKAYFNAEWHGPSQGLLDPVKEVKAASMRVAEGFSTRERETAELTGGDWDINVEQIAKEEERMKKLKIGVDSNKLG